MGCHSHFPILYRTLKKHAKFIQPGEPSTVRGWGINISEDFRHWIGLLQYNHSTLLHIKSYILSYTHVSFTNWYSVGAAPTCGDYIIYEGMSHIQVCSALHN
jgi:hypothetical protein